MRSLAPVRHVRYDLHNFHTEIGAMSADLADIEKRLNAGAWLRPGEVGALFGRTRWAVNYWMQTGKIGFRKSPGGHREADPDDVKRILAEHRQEHPATGSEPSQ